MQCVYNLGYLLCLTKMAVTTESNGDWCEIWFFCCCLWWVFLGFFLVFFFFFLRNSLLFPYVFALPSLEVVDDACV